MATDRGDKNFWDRPIVVALIGSVFLGLFTTAWQIKESKSRLELEYERILLSERMSLLQEFPSKYEAIGNILNAWFTRVTWIAEETNKTTTKKTRDNINVWRKAIYNLETKYQESGSLDGHLARIGVSYRCPAVKESANKLLIEWHLFQNTFQEFNQEWNDNQKLLPGAIEKAKAERVRILGSLEMKQKELIENMSGELFRARQNISDCPV